MSDVIERIKRKIIETSAELVEATVTDTIIPLDEALAVIDEESAKEPQECNSDLISRNMLIESFKASMNTGYETFPFDIIVEAINNQPQVQQVQK